MKPVTLTQSHSVLSKIKENKPVNSLDLRQGNGAEDIPTYVMWDFKEQIFLSSSNINVFCLNPIQLSTW